MLEMGNSFHKLGEVTRKLDKILTWNQKQTIEDAKIRIRNHGGKINQFQQSIVMLRSARPGLKVWAAIDCLVNYGGYAFRWEVL